MSRLIEIPDNGIIEFPIMRGEDTIGVERIDLSEYPIVDRLKGKWLVQKGPDMVEDGIVCQNCGRYIHDFLPLKPDICTLDFEKELVGGFTFCPNCGASMGETANVG